MIANYHTHTWRCNHATGREEEYVRTAIEQGFKILGFSDHSPYCFPGDYVSGIRMRTDQFSDYCSVIRMLQKKYADQIRIPLGVEIEYYPACFQPTLELLRDGGVEYMLLGQHFVVNEMDGVYCGRATAEEEILKCYCHQAMDAMQTGLFTYFAHPDLIHFKGDEDIYRRYMRHLCAEAKSCGIPLELNLLGKWSGRHYPACRFWEIAAEEGCNVVLGCDAHAPEHLKKMEAKLQLTELARKLNLNLLESVTLKPL